MLPQTFFLALLAAQAPRIELPAGPAAELAARLDPGVTPAELPVVAEQAWARGETWKRWSELLKLEAGAAGPDPARRAELALLALEQGRYEDAWDRFAQCAPAPPVAAALLARLLPGAPAGPLADGAVLRPALPPPGAASTPPRGIDRRAMRIEGLAVGAAVIGLRISVEVEGVQIDVEHLSGGPAKLSIAIPEDPRFGFSDEYVDWYRAETKGVPHALAIAPGEEPHTLYARFEPRAPEWPTLVPAEIPAQIGSGGLYLEARSGDVDPAFLRAVAESLAAGPLHLPATVRKAGDPPGNFTGVTIDLSDPANRARKLAWIAGAVEARARALGK